MDPRYQHPTLARKAEIARSHRSVANNRVLRVTSRRVGANTLRGRRQRDFRKRISVLAIVRSGR